MLVPVFSLTCQIIRERYCQRYVWQPLLPQLQAAPDAYFYNQVARLFWSALNHQKTGQALPCCPGQSGTSACYLVKYTNGVVYWLVLTPTLPLSHRHICFHWYHMWGAEDHKDYTKIISHFQHLWEIFTQNQQRLWLSNKLAFSINGCAVVFSSAVEIICLLYRLLSRLGVPTQERKFSDAKQPLVHGYQTLGDRIVLQKKVNVSS